MIKAVKLEASAELATTTSSADKMEAVATSANNNSNGDTTVVPPSAVDADVLESLDDGLHFNPAELDEKAVLGEDDESTAIADQQEMAATVYVHYFVRNETRKHIRKFAEV
jgi:hypothetical protein